MIFGLPDMARFRVTKVNQEGGIVTDDDVEVYTPREARRILRLSHNGIYLAIKRGEIPHIRFGKKIAILRRALEKMLEGAARDDR